MKLFLVILFAALLVAVSDLILFKIYKKFLFFVKKVAAHSTAFYNRERADHGPSPAPSKFLLNLQNENPNNFLGDHNMTSFDKRFRSQPYPPDSDE